MLSLFCRYILLGFVFMMALAPLSAQVRVSGVITDSAKKPIEATIIVSRSSSGGFFFPEHDGIDTIKTLNSRYECTLRRAGAYFLCVRAANNVALNIPIILESLTTDSIRLDIEVHPYMPRVVAAKPFEYLSEMYILHRHFAERFLEAWKAYEIAHEQQIKPSPFNDSAIRSYLFQITTAADKHILLRRLAGNYLSRKMPAGMYGWKELVPFNKAILSVLSSDSYFWSLNGANAVGDGLMQHDTTEQHPNFDLLNSIRLHNPETRVRAFTLMNLLYIARHHNIDSLLAEVCMDCSKNYLNNPTINKEIKRYLHDSFNLKCATNNRIASGKPAPDFAIKLSGNKSNLTKSSMLGKPYLIDFWSTSCGACILEMPILEELYKKYSKEGFSIISITYETPKKLALFRKNRYAMPWLHATPEGKELEELEKIFETYSSMPNPILIGADGTILANRGDAMGDRLKAKLEAVFKK